MEFSEITNKDGFTLTFFLPGSTAATGGNFDITFPVDRPCELAKVRVRYTVASSSGTLQIQTVPSGTAPGSGSNLLSTAISLSATANTVYRRDENDFVTTVSRRFTEGMSIGFADGGTLTGLENLSVVLYFRPLGKGQYR